MKRWMIVGGFAALGVGAGLWFAKRENPQPEAPPQTSVVTTGVPTTPVIPVVLADVVEVANIDPLLDPPAQEPGGEPFDVDPPATVLLSTPTPPDHIPHAID